VEVFATAAVRADERFAYWREAICDVFVHLDADPLVRPVPAFRGRIATRGTGPVRVSEVAADPQHVVRSPRQIARDPEDALLVSLQVDGTGRVEQDGRVAALAPGDLALYDSARPYVLHFDGAFRQHVLQFPRAALRERVRDPERLTAVRVAGTGAGAVAGAFLRAVLAHADELDPIAAERLGAQALDLFAVALSLGAEGAGPARVDPAAQRLALRRRVHALIEAHLADPLLSPASVAAALHLSVRTLHKLFEDQPETVARLIARRRLERTAADLADPRLAGRTVTWIAFSWGFRDAAHFSRAFRQRYGVAPVEHRRRAATGGSPGPAPSPGAGAPGGGGRGR